MKRILFVTSRNICNSGGELQLIKGRSDTLKKEYQADTDFLSFIAQRKYKKNTQLADYDVDITTYKRSGDIIYKYFKFVNKVKKKLRECRYGVVVVSGKFPGNIAKSIRKITNSYLVYDCHGALEELLEFNSTLKRKIMYFVLSISEKSTIKKANGIFAVSDGLVKYLRKKYNFTGDIFKIPCATKTNKITYEEIAEKRKNKREELGIDDGEVLFIYSGGISPWQCIDESYRIYKKFSKERKSKFLIMTTNPEAIVYEDVIVKKVLPTEIEEYMYAGDVAFLIREDKITNNVAFPNKYLEYVKSNMAIISTPFLGEISKEIEEKKLGIIVNSVENFSSERLMAALSEKQPKEELKKRKKIVENYGFKVNVKDFAEKMDF